LEVLRIGTGEEAANMEGLGFGLDDVAAGREAEVAKVTMAMVRNNK
jgi:hypothetical protein